MQNCRSHASPVLHSIIMKCNPLAVRCDTVAHQGHTCPTRLFEASKNQVRRRSTCGRKSLSFSDEYLATVFFTFQVEDGNTMILNSLTAKDGRRLAESPVTPEVSPCASSFTCAPQIHERGNRTDKGIVQTTEKGDSSSGCACNKFSETVHPPTLMPQSLLSLCRCRSPQQCRSPQYCGIRTPFVMIYTLYRSLACGSRLAEVEGIGKSGSSCSAEAGRTANSQSRRPTGVLSAEQAAERGCFVKGYARG